MVRAVAPQVGGDDGIVILRSGSADLSAGTIDIPATTSKTPRAAVRAPVAVVKAPSQVVVPTLAPPAPVGEQKEPDHYGPDVASYLYEAPNKQAAYLEFQDELRKQVDEATAILRAMQKVDEVSIPDLEHRIGQLQDEHEKMGLRCFQFKYHSVVGLAQTTLATARAKSYVEMLSDPQKYHYYLNAHGQQNFFVQLQDAIDQLAELRARIR